jgi:hypothetical protein
MLKPSTALFVLLMFICSCTKESVIPEPDFGSDALKGAKLRTKTLKIHDSSGEMGVIPCSLYDLYDDCSSCETGFVFYVEGTGHATHLGAFTVQNYACMEPGIGTLEPLNGVLTAANGDQIFTRVAYYIPDPDLGLIYHYEVLRGSGRFEGATGYIDMWGDIDYDLMKFDLQGLGEITY